MALVTYWIRDILWQVTVNVIRSLLCSQGVSYDHVELNFFLNGQSLQCPILGIKGTVFPVFYGKCVQP